MSINLTAVIDNDEAIRKLRELQKTAKNVTSNVVTDADRMDIAMKRLASTLGQIGAGVSLAGLVRQIARTRGEFQQLEVAFTTLLQSKEKADALMSQMVELAAKTPFDLQGVASGARQLLAYGFAAEDVTDVLTRLGNVAAGLGLNLQDLTWLYGTTAVQGRLYTRDVMQFQSRGIDLAGELATQLGKTRAEISQMVTEGKIGFPEVQKAIENMTNEGGKFYNLMQEQSKTITGLISNLGDAIDMMFNDIGKSQEGVITSVLQGTISLVENYQKVLDILIPLVAAYGAYKTALILTAAAQKAVVTAKEISAFFSLAKGITSAKDAMVLFNTVVKSNPLVLALSALVALGTAVYRYSQNISESAEAIEKVNKAIDEYNQKLDEQKSKAEQMHSVMQDDVSTAYSKQKAYQDLIRLYPELLEKYSEEEIRLMSLIDLTKELNRLNGVREEGNLQKQYDTTLDKVRELRAELSIPTLGIAAKISLSSQLKKLEAELSGYKNKIDELKETQKAAEWANTPVEVKIATLQGNIDELKAQNDEIDRLIEEAKNKRKNEPQTFIPYDESEDYYQSLKQANLKQIANKQSEISSLQGGSNKATIQNKSYWENLKKEAVASLEAMDASLKGTAKWNELVAKIAEYDKKIKQYGVSGKTVTDATKAQKELSELIWTNSIALEQSRIDTLPDGKEKELAEINLLEKEWLKRLEDDRQKLQEAQKTELTAEQTKDFDERKANIEQTASNKRAAVELKYAQDVDLLYKQITDVFLTEEERKRQGVQKTFDEYRRQAESLLKGGSIGGKGYSVLMGEIDRAETKSMLQDVLREYETFEQQKARITEEYNDKIARLEEQNANGQYNENIEEIKRQRDLEIAQLQISESDFFQVISGNLEEYGLATIRDAIAQAKEYLDNFIADAKSKNGGKLTNEQLQFVTQMRQDLDKATKVVHYRLPEGLAKAASGMKKVADSAKELDESLGNVLDTVSNMIQGFSDIESGISGLKEASANFKQMKQDAKDQGKSLGFGDILGTVGSYAGAIGSIVSGVTSIFGSLFSSKGNSQEVEATIERLTVRNELLQEAIERLTDKIGSGSVMDSVQAYEKAVEKQKEQNENYRKIAEAKGSYWSSHHSWNYNWGGFTDEELAWIQKNVREGFTNKDSIFSLTPEEMATLLENTGIADRIYNTAGSYGRDVYNTLVDYAGQAGKLEEITDKLNESLTQISFDSLRDSFVDSLMDMDKSAEDFADDFRSYLMRAVLNSKISELLDDELNDFYEKWVEYTKSGGGLDKGEIDELKGIWDGITEEGIKIRDELATITGYTGSLQADSQSATSRGYQIATQDDITEQNGRLTDIQGKMSILVSGVDKLSSLGLETKNEIVNMRDIMIQLNGNVADIRTYTKVLPQMNATLISVDRKLNNL